MIRINEQALEKVLRSANWSESAGEYIKKARMIGFFYSLLPSFFLLLVLSKEKASFLLIIPAFAVFFLMFYGLMLQVPKMAVRRRKVEIESDLIYSARYMLLKLESGAPLLNALIDTADIHTSSSKYFKEIVSNIYMGEPIEKAIEYAEEYAPSEQFKLVMKEIQNALRTGVDLKRSLNETVKEISKNHIISVKEYGKRLGPLSMFYMIFGAIVPSLGVALVVLAASFIQVRITLGILMFFVLCISMLQGFFIITFNAVKA